MSTEPCGRYGEVAGDISGAPKGIVRVPCSRDEAEALQRLIRFTGCTVAEIRYDPDDDKKKRVTIIYGAGNLPAEAIRIAKEHGLAVDMVLRRRP